MQTQLTPGLLSVVIPCFNYGQYLREAVASVEACRPLPVELIIVNDGSTDADTLRVLDELASQGIVVVHQHNQGVGAACNSGVRASRGEYFIPLAADDRIRSGFVGKGLDVLMRQPEVSVVYGLPHYFGDPLPVPMLEVTEYSLERLREENYINATALIRRKDFDEIGGYDASRAAQGLEDWDFWLRLAERGKKFHFLAEEAFDYRIHMDSLSRAMGSAGYRRVYRHMESKHPAVNFLKTASNRLDVYVRTPERFDASHLERLASQLHGFVVDYTFAGDDGRASAALDLIRRCESASGKRYPTSLAALVYSVRDQSPRLPDDQAICRMQSLVRRLQSLRLCAFSPQAAESFFWEVEAFEAYRRGDRGRTWRSVARAIGSNPARIRNRGLLSIAMRAIGGGVSDTAAPALPRPEQQT